MTDDIKITEIINPASVGWEWTDPEGTTVQVAWARGLQSLQMALRDKDSTRWRMHTTLDRGRWSCDGTLTDARRVAKDFLETARRDFLASS